MDSEVRVKPVFEQLNRVLWFFLCIFGALAAIGVVFNMLEYPDNQQYVALGFGGTATTMVLMGLMQLA